MANNNPPLPGAPPTHMMIAPNDKYILVRLDDKAEQLQILASAVVDQKEQIAMILGALNQLIAMAFNSNDNRIATPASPLIKV